MGELIFHIFLMIVMAVFYQQSYSINLRRSVDPVGAAGFPRAIIILAMVLILISLISLIRRKKEFKFSVPKELNIHFMKIFIAIIGFVLLVNYIGFFLSAFILILTIMYVLGQKNIKKIVFIALLASSSYMILFGKILSIPLPRGIGILRTISYFIY
jgi:hypothetical protein